MKILITGASGYCGNFLAVYFAGKGVPVVGLDKVPHPVDMEVANYKFVGADIRDRESLKKIFTEEAPTHVIHLAYLMDPVHDKKFEYDVDVNGSKYAFEVANETSSVKQFILMSSASAYGAYPDNPEWITEETPLRPGDYNYGIYKKEIEEYYKNFAKRENLKLFIFRMCTAVGPSYYKSGGVVSTVAKSPFMFNILGCNGRVQFIHENDVKELFDKVVNDPGAEGVYNLAPDSYSSTRELGLALHKKFIPIPLWWLRAIFWKLWHFHLAALTPAMARLMAYGIIVSPKKLMARYNYTFKYSTKDAFFDALEKRKQNGTL